MAVTLMEAALAGDADPKQKNIIQLFTQISPVFDSIPMTKIDGRVYPYEREAAMPSVMWRAVNQAYNESTGSTTPFAENLKIVGGEVKVDAFIQRTKPSGRRDELRKQMKMKVRAAANEWDRAFFEGSELVDVNEMVGLRSRITGNQLINMGGAAMSLPKLDEALDAVPFPNKHIYLNRTLRRKLNALLDAATGSRRIEEDRNQWGMQIERYGGATLHVVEQSGDASTILGFDEDNGGGANTASIYIVAYGDDLVHGIYNNGDEGDLIIVQEFGELETEPRYMVRFEGYYGLAIEHPRAAARFYNITNA